MAVLDLRAAMRLMVGPVCVVTSGVGPRRTGATVTTAHSLSLDPETMVVSLNIGSSTYCEIVECGFFCVNVLAAHQQDVAERFSGRGGAKGIERYSGAHWRPLRSGALALAGALSNVDCDVEEILVRHSHALIVGRVCAVEMGEPVDGLVYRAGSYGAYLSPDARDAQARVERNSTIEAREA